MQHQQPGDPLEGRRQPLSTLPWPRQLRYLPAFLGYPISGFFIVLGLVLLTTMAEGIGVALIYPVIELMQNGGDPASIAARSKVFRTIGDVLGRFGIPLTFGWLILTASFALVLRQMLTYITSTYRADLNFRAVEQIGSRTFRLFAEAGVSYAERSRSGSLINAVLTEAKRAGNLIAALQNIVGCALRIGIYLVLLLALSWQATLAGMALLGVTSLVVARRTVRASRQTGKKIAHANDALTRYAAERFGLAYLMKIAGTSGFEAEEFASRNASLRRMNVQNSRQAARLNALIEGAVVIGGLAIVYAATQWLALSLGALAVFLIAILRLMPVVQELAQSVQHVATCSSGLRRIDELNLEAIAAREPDQGDKPFCKLETEINFDHVSFQYVSEEGTNAFKALQDVCVQIPAGCTTALVGPSGAGKSTLMDLIPRLRVPTEGSIYFDGVPAETLRLSDLRDRIAVVSQDALVIDGTIAENLRYGHTTADDGAIERAARAAHAHDFIERLPLGYRTVIGERGILLSGGQKQRLALARALVKDVSILLLDEPTSALDAESEQAVQQALAELQASRKVTVVIIAHRLSTVRHADHIIVLDRGRVLGSGRHEQLIKTAPWYRQIVELQLGQSAGEPLPQVAVH